MSIRLMTFCIIPNLTLPRGPCFAGEAKQHIRRNYVCPFFVYVWGPVVTQNYKINLLFCQYRILPTAESVSFGDFEFFLSSLHGGNHSLYIISLALLGSPFVCFARSPNESYFSWNGKVNHISLIFNSHAYISFIFFVLLCLHWYSVLIIV